MLEFSDYRHLVLGMAKIPSNRKGHDSNGNNRTIIKDGEGTGITIRIMDREAGDEDNTIITLGMTTKNLRGRNQLG